jgi:ATP-dependent DNA helicase RecQ
VRADLKRLFGYDSFREYNGEPLQENAARAAVCGKSLLAVFPTGGGKSLTFQLPALMAGRAVHGLTVVISPLQSLMKDQVDNLERAGIADAVTVNGLLSQVERAEALGRVASGLASILYISPEQLRSRTIERLLLSRSVARFVIDEAHCFSAWGQDFRVDYMYIGEFIRELQEKKAAGAKAGSGEDADFGEGASSGTGAVAANSVMDAGAGAIAPIPVSCFTATAKQKVISDIRDYFKKKLGLGLELYATSAERVNLRYSVLYKETEEEKYAALRALIQQKDCPTIIYASRTKRTKELAERLSGDGFPARPFHGKMDPRDKVANQEAFIANEISIIVATSAFGMGVDKRDVGLVVHYDISSSLESYVQEAGRAGREPSLTADCYVLFSDGDLDKHFLLLNQTKLSICEIQQVWKAVRDLAGNRRRVYCSPLEIARQAGWGNSSSDSETRVRAAVAALENAGYVRRGKNTPHVYATSILAKNMQEAVGAIDASALFSDRQRQDAHRIIGALISSRSIAKAGNDVAESRVDYLSDMLGIEKRDVLNSIGLMREAGLLADSMDMSAYMRRTDAENKSKQALDRFARLEGFLLSKLADGGIDASAKDLNEQALGAGIAHSTVKGIRTVLFYWIIKGYIQKDAHIADRKPSIVPLYGAAALRDKYERRIDVCRFIVDELFAKSAARPKGAGAVNAAVAAANAAVAAAIAANSGMNAGAGAVAANSVMHADAGEDVHVQFSLLGMFRAYCDEPKLETFGSKASTADIEDALLYLSKIGALILEGGFLVLYNTLELERLAMGGRARYKREDYKLLSEFYKQKIQQIHIVGEYANLMVRDYDAALRFVRDYFQIDYRKFIATYFKGTRAAQISRGITPDKYKQIIGGLSDVQAKIVCDDASKYIVVAAGPGSGKTRVLAHKLASLLMLEDVKHDQLLMLTFSRAAATEFKKRLAGLIGGAAAFVGIKTFHSYCFDLLGKEWRLEWADSAASDAAEMINSGEAEMGQITKSVVVIDEAQDMDEHEYALVEALMRRNDSLRVIAVGDDDQNIFGFRGASSKYMRSFIDGHGAVKYEMAENYRSKSCIVDFANAFAETLPDRMRLAPALAVSGERGIVRLTKHRSRSLEEPVAEHVRAAVAGAKAGSGAGAKAGSGAGAKAGSGAGADFGEGANSGTGAVAANSVMDAGADAANAAVAAAAAANSGMGAAKPEGAAESIAVLTNTNDEALRVFRLLMKKGVRATLVQAGAGFSLYNLAEVRFFLKSLDNNPEQSAITGETWDRAIARLSKTYRDSACLGACLNMLADFASVSQVKYRSDLEEFIKESHYEDFWRDGRGDVFVSTVHKAKGREFDRVFMLIGNNSASLGSADDRRRIYVGLTRARNELYIHYNGSAFDGFDVPGAERLVDSAYYREPDEIMLQLTYKDAVLDYFKNRKTDILKLRSGAELRLDGEYMTADVNGRAARVLKLSKAGALRIGEQRRKGYEPYRAEIRFIVAWKGENDCSESAVILADLYLKKAPLDTA